MICYTVTVWVDGQHGNSFHVLLEGVDHIEEFCEILEASGEVQFFELRDDEKVVRDGVGVWKEGDDEFV